MQEYVSMREASKLATEYAGKPVSESNIGYLIQYGRIDKFESTAGTCVSTAQLMDYYASGRNQREREWKRQLGNDLNWQLSFDNYTEAETTKHVHRLHPYKGKFIPQLVEYFLDAHTDVFKKEVFFHAGDIILDPFCGSGTMLVQANELGMHALGVDVSKFNAMIANCKTEIHDIVKLTAAINDITKRLDAFDAYLGVAKFERELLNELSIFNSEFFPSPEFKKRVYRGEVSEFKYGEEKSHEFLTIFERLAEKYGISMPKTHDSFLGKWYFDTSRQEIAYAKQLIDDITDADINMVLKVILSRTMRSCRATTHSDLATLVEPVYTTYYCSKHKKICKPLFSILRWWKTYSKDTIARFAEFNSLRTSTEQYCLTGDSRTLDLEALIERNGGELARVYGENKIRGIFSSPPYVGLIDYHEQHAYAYELFGFERNDEKEIGRMLSGSGYEARNNYIAGIADVLINARKVLADDYEVFLVANDKFNLYPTIADKAGMRIVDVFKRPVLNRTEKDKNAYSESIFRMKEK